MKHLKVNTLIAAMSLIASLFSCSLNAMNVVQQKSPLSIERRQKMLATMPKGKILEAARTSEVARKKTNLVNIFAASSCKEDEFFIYEEGSYSGICVSPEVVRLCGTLDVNIDKKSIPIYDFSNAIIKNTFDVLKIYEPNKNRSKDVIQRSIKKVTDNYSQEQLIGVANCISYLDGPEDVQRVCLDEIKAKYKDDIEAIISNQNLNEDLRQLFIAQPTADCLTSLLQKNNMQRTKNILRDYSRGLPTTSSVAINSDGTRIVEGLATGFKVRNASGGILLDRPMVTFAVAVVAMSPDGTKVILGDALRPILRIFDANSGAALYNLVGHEGKITSVAFSSDGTKIVSGSFGNANNIIVWDAANGTQIASMGGIAGSVTAVAFNAGGTKVVSGHSSKDNNPADVVVWDFEDVPSKSTYLNGFGKRINSVSFCPTDDTKILYVGDSADPTNTSLLNVKTTEAFLLDVKSKIITKLTEGPRKTAEGLGVFSFPIKALFTPDGKTIVIGETYGIRILNLDNNYNVVEETFSKIGNPWNKLRSMAISLDGRKMIFGYNLSGISGNFPALVTFTLWTDEDETLINQIKNRTLAETKLIFRLCSEFNKQGSVKELRESTDIKTFVDLPQDLQQLLSDTFWHKRKGFFPGRFSGWFSGWW